MNTLKLRHLVRVVTVLIGTVAARAASPLDTATNASNAHIYHLVAYASSSWSTLEAQAVQMGGHLVTIRNQAEQDWLVNRWGAMGTLFIGLNVGLGYGPAFTPSWSSREPVNYSNWAQGQPEQSLGSPSGGSLVGLLNGATGKWSLAGAASPPGLTNYYGVIEIAPASSSPITVSIYMGLPGATNRGPNITWSSVQGADYRIWRVQSLGTTNWTVIWPSFRATNGSSVVLDTNGFSQSSFYRIELLQSQ